MSRSPAPPAAPAYVGFAVFGGFWGTWGASIPAIREQAGVTDGQLGAALLFIGAGALPALLVAGPLVDRWGQRAAGALLGALGAAGLLVAGTAHSLASLSLGLAVLGAASGAADVGINSAAGSVQHSTGAPVISRAHAAFSAAVVLTSLTTGALHAAGAPTLAPFALLSVAAGIAAALLLLTAPARPTGAGATAPTEARGPDPGPRRLLLLLGGLGALAFAVENGHQSWSALYLGDVLHADELTAAAGPALFAGVVAVTRLTAGPLSTRRPTAVLLLGSLTAAAGTATVGAAPDLAVGLLGLGLAAAGTAVLFPTLLNVLTDHVPEHSRGRATSTVTAIAYLGFLAGPVYVGLWAQTAGLTHAMLALAALALTLAAAAPLALRDRHAPRNLTR